MSSRFEWLFVNFATIGTTILNITMVEMIQLILTAVGVLSLAFYNAMRAAKMWQEYRHDRSDHDYNVEQREKKIIEEQEE